MKVKIDTRGWLLLERAGKMTEQYCPFCNGDGRCGDWCPHFTNSAPVKDNYHDRFSIVSLMLCHNRKITCCSEDFIDERPTEEEIYIEEGPIYEGEE